MNPETRNGGISCAGLDPAYYTEELRKTNLFLEAKYLCDTQHPEEAFPKLAEAAAIEERLADMSEAKGLFRNAWVHRYSAICAWAQAGNMYTAIASGDRLLAHPDLPERLRQEVAKYVQTLRGIREEWREERTREPVAG